MDIIIVIEIWLNDNIFNSEILFIGYNIIRKDCYFGKCGGGVLIVLWNNIYYNLVLFGVWLRELEIVVVEIEFVNIKKILICVCYWLFSVDINEWLCLFFLFLELSFIYELIFICGDFNFFDLYWNFYFVF